MSYIRLVMLVLFTLLLGACGGGKEDQVKVTPLANVDAQDAATKSPPGQLSPPAAPSYSWPAPLLVSSQSSTTVLQNNASGFTCATGAITCVEVVSNGNTLQASVPVTFGQPFRAGELMSSKYLAAKDNLGNTVAVQLDATALRSDNSVRFGVVSAWLSNLEAGERRVVSLFVTTTPPPAAVRPDATAHDLTVEARTFQPQVTMVLFGNRAGHTWGDPFVRGESIKMVLNGPTREEFTLTLEAKHEGGGFVSLTEIARSFTSLVNARNNSSFKADDKDGSQFEKMWVTTKDPGAGAFTVSFEYTGAGKLTTSAVSTFGPPRTWTASANAAIRTAVQNNTNMHLRGHVANEYIVVQRFKDTSGNTHPQLTARFNTRLLDGGQRARTDLVIENNWAYDPSPGNLTYSLQARINGAVVLDQPVFMHNHHSRWHRVLWQGPEVKARVRHHMPYFMHSRVVWNYDLTLNVPSTVTQQLADRLAAQPADPMNGMFISRYFPMTGGRDEIGPYPKWTALFLVTQHDAARAATLANGTAAGVVPIHYRDSQTDQPLSIDKYPQAATMAGQSPYLANNFPEMADGLTDWTPDVAHQGSFAFVPYLVTGDVFYLDEVMFWAAWNLASQNPGYREGSKGLLQPDQVRAQAWGIRSIGEAARIIPDVHPMKSYFEAKLDNNLSWYLAKYTPANAASGEVSPLGAHHLSDTNAWSLSWQSDFLAIVLSQLSGEGYTKASDYLAWLSRFNVGRFLQESAGLCLTHAPAMRHRLRADGGSPATTWAQFVALQDWAGTNCSTSNMLTEAFPDSAYGYAAVARAMLGATVNAGIADARQAYPVWDGKLYSLSGRSSAAIFSQDPTWAIVPAN